MAMSLGLYEDHLAKLLCVARTGNSLALAGHSAGLILHQLSSVTLEVRPPRHERAEGI